VQDKVRKMFADGAFRRREKKTKALSLGDWGINSYSLPQNIRGNSDFGCQSIPWIGSLGNDSVGS